MSDSRIAVRKSPPPRYSKLFSRVTHDHRVKIDLHRVEQIIAGRVAIRSVGEISVQPHVIAVVELSPREARFNRSAAFSWLASFANAESR